MSQKILSERYQLLEIVGQGGMATVYKAKDLVLNRIVAVKILNPDRTQEEFIQRFIWEAKATGRLSHENIVNIYDIKSEDQIHYMVMEYVDGITLKELIQQEGKISIEKAIFIAIQICDALAHAHQNGIIHRDIKPQNIICTTDQKYRITDFGISRFIKDSAQLTKTGNVMGSVHYFSPEQAQGKPVDFTTDLYSFGVVLYEMVTGQPPYDAPEQVAIALQHIQNKIPNPKDLNPDLPNAFSKLIQKAMAKKPKDRFRSATEMKQKLEDIKSSLQNKQPVSEKNEKTKQPITSQSTKSTKRSAKLIWGTAIILSVLLLMLGYSYVDAKFFQQPSPKKITHEKPENKTLPKSTSQNETIPKDEQPIEKDDPPPPKKKKEPKTDHPTKKDNISNQYMILVGSFQQQENAEHLVRNLNQNGFKASIQKSIVFGNTMYRVIGGEFHTRSEAEQELIRIKQSGIEGTNQAIIVDLKQSNPKN